MNQKHLLLVATAVVILTACARSSGNESKSDSSTASNDSVQVDSALAEEFTSPDLIYAEVKGSVVKIAEIFENQEYVLYEFDDKGVYKRGSRLEHVQNLERDGDGRIVGGDNGYYKVIWEDDKVKRTIINESDGTLLTELNHYNEDGNLTRKTLTSEGPDGDNTWTLDFTYSSDSFDEHGNWIKRNVHSSDKDVKDYQEIRKIYYSSL